MRSLANVPLCSLLSCGAAGQDYVASKVELPSKFVSRDTASIERVARNAQRIQRDDPLLADQVSCGSAQNLDVQTALGRIAES